MSETTRSRKIKTLLGGTGLRPVVSGVPPETLAQTQLPASHALIVIDRHKRNPAGRRISQAGRLCHQMFRAAHPDAITATLEARGVGIILDDIIELGAGEVGFFAREA